MKTRTLTRTLLATALAATLVTAYAGVQDGMMRDGKMQGATMDAKMNPMVGGGMMDAKKDIVTNALNSKNHTTLVAALKAAGLVETLQGKGPFTVFAPINAAFAALPEGTVDTLLKPENKPLLTSILTYHVVAGNYDAAKIMDAIKKGQGQATFTTVNGAKLTARMNGPRNVVLADNAGNVATISTYDVKQSNGVIHVIDSVLMPTASN